MGFRYTKLTNLFKSVRKQNFTSNPFRLCMCWSHILVGTFEFRWNHWVHYFASEEVTIVLATHCMSKTVFKCNSEMAKSHFRVIVTIQIHSVWLAHKVNGYSDSMWELLVGLHGKLRIGQNSNRQLRKCMIFYWWLTSTDIYENGLKLKVHA